VTKLSIRERERRGSTRETASGRKIDGGRETSGSQRERASRNHWASRKKVAPYFVKIWVRKRKRKSRRNHCAGH
jgi:hypothetical protein